MPEPLQSATGNYNAQAYGEGASATVNIGYTPEQIAPLLQAAGAAAQAQITELAAQLTTSREVTLGFLRILREDGVPTEQLAAKLALIAGRYLSMMERLGSLDPEDATARAYIEQAQQVLREASSAHDYDHTDELLSRAEDAQGNSIERVEALEREAHDAARRLRRDRGATRAERGQLSLTRLDYIQAAEHYSKAADLVAAEDIAIRLDYFRRSADALQSHGDEKGDNAVLMRAIYRYKDLLIETSKEHMPLLWAATQSNLGNTLWMLGRSETKTTLFEEALFAHQSALHVYDRVRMPLQWAATQGNLGNVLSTWGERESGIIRLSEAVARYRSALEEYCRESVPLVWAAVQINLGNALSALDERERGPMLLEQAAEAYRNALEEYARARAPLLWATTQNNLGNTLRKLGEREGKTTLLEEALMAHRNALQERTRERVPLLWATTQNNLGTALSTLGQRESGILRLIEAVEAFNSALEENTRERVPLEWATTQNNLGSALCVLGARESGTVRLEKAVAAFRSALEERTRQLVPLLWAMTQDNLGTALRLLGERESGTVRLKDARRCIAGAWDVDRAAGVRRYDQHYQRRLYEIDTLIGRRLLSELRGAI